MYGLPEDFDPSLFLGRELLQICVGRYDLQLHFEEIDGRAISISMQSQFSFGRSRYATGPEAGRLSELVGRKVRGASRVGRGDLRLDFGRRVLRIHEDADNFESYTITYGEDYWVV